MLHKMYSYVSLLMLVKILINNIIVVTVNCVNNKIQVTSAVRW